ncbi:hypothetical protein Bca4012_093396 [Brassica carinata]
MAGRLHAILLLALHLFVSENKCDQTVWSVVFSWESQISNTGFTLRRGESRALQAPSSWYGIISGRTLCSNESRGNFSFATGDCESNKIECPGSYGWSTVTYIYFRIDYSGTNSYFISLEYGYNLPVMVVPSHSNPTCFSSGCMVGLNKTCPNKLMIYDGIIPIACSSACKESSTHENCCTNYFGSRQTCKATLYSQNFERACPLAYSYPYSDSNSTFTCPNTTNYVITFCPSSIPNTTRTVRKSQLTGRETVFDRVRPNTGRDTSGRTRVKDEIVRPHKDGASSYSHVHRSTHSSRSSRVTKPRDSRYNPYSYVRSHASSGKQQDAALLLFFYLAGGLAALALISIIFAIAVILSAKRKSHSKDEDIEAAVMLKRYSYDTVTKMTKSFTHPLGEGGFGTVFNGKLPDATGRDIALKILTESKGNGEDFINELASMSRASHVNIFSLFGFCYEGSKRAIIYDFMPNGFLDKFISAIMSTKMNWNTLYNIAIGVARGLEHLHSSCVPEIVHFDIKPHNILMDRDLCPKISDFGLAKLCKNKESVISLMDPRGTIGYIAPEVVSRNYGGASHK